MKLSQALTGFWLDKRLSLSDTTIARYTYAFDEFMRIVGDIEIDQVTSADVRKFLVHLADRPHKQDENRRLTKRTIHDYWQPLSSLWTWAEKELGIEHVIRGKVQSPEYQAREIDPFTQDEVKALIRAVIHSKEWTTRSGKQTQSKRHTAKRDEAIILTLLDTGVRASELCALVIRDYDQKRGRLHIRHGKGDKERYAIMGNRTQKAIWRYLTTRLDAKANEPLFVSSNGTHLKRDNLYHMLTRLAEKAGVSKANPHRFRHTFAINFLRNGGNVFVLKELLGHSSLDVSLIYLKLAEQDIDAANRHSPVDNWRI